MDKGANPDSGKGFQLEQRKGGQEQHGQAALQDR